MIVEMQTAIGRTLLPGTPIKFSDTPASVRTPPPGFGEHTDAVLAALGFNAAHIGTLRGEGVV
jgi:crotonobetainyl-CoA:carnitine CoA-transferase CaiB-like acyl-CoA transferase